MIATGIDIEKQSKPLIKAYRNLDIAGHNWNTQPEFETLQAYEFHKAYVASYTDAIRNLAPDHAKDIIGYAYAGPFRDRSGYRYTVEDSIYVAKEALGRNVGNALMVELIERCTALGFRQMIAVIGDSTNAASLALHSRHGFFVVGALSSACFKFGRWVDAVLMQRILGEGDTTLPPKVPGKRSAKKPK